jgi:choline dehydrogenase
MRARRKAQRCGAVLRSEHCAMARILECDYLVVGGGTAGCVLAARLSEDRGKRVLLLEAGGRDDHAVMRVPGLVAFTFTSPRFNWSAATEAEPELGGRKLFVSQARVLGGGSSINGMVYSRGQPWDFDHWRDLGCPGWGYEDVLPLFRQSETSERGASRWHGDSGPLAVARGRSELAICEPFLEAVRESGLKVTDDTNAGDGDGIGYYDTTVERGLRSSTSRAFLRPALARPNLEVHTGALATRLVIERGRAVGCEFIQGNEGRLARAAEEVIVSSGALRSPQLLMLSGIGPALHLREHGIAVAVDSPEVGANLQNHVSYKLAWTCSQPVTGYQYLNPAGVLRLAAQYLVSRSGYLSHAPTPLGGLFRSDEALEVPDLQMFLNPALVGRIDQGLLKLLPREHGFSIFVNQGRPWSRGRVTLASTDPRANPRVFGNYFSDRRDLDVLARGAERLRELAKAKALAPYVEREFLPGPEVRTRTELEAHIRANCSNHWHVSGTCRMGGDDRAVLDARLRVRGIDGLRVADGSVMPTLVNGNTAAPIIMIGEKCAQMVREDAA